MRIRFKHPSIEHIAYTIAVPMEGLYTLAIKVQTQETQCFLFASGARGEIRLTEILPIWILLRFLKAGIPIIDTEKPTIVNSIIEALCVQGVAEIVEG